MAVHRVEPNLESLHGAFSREFPPLITIDAGDTVIFRTLDAGWSIEPRTSPVFEDMPKKFEPRSRGQGHALCGPVAIKGAMPGMTLEVKVKRVVTGTWGWTGASGFNHEVNRRLGLDKAGHIILLWDLDAKAGVGRNQHGDEIKLRPFMGVMGMPADVEGLQSTIPPRRTGGNLDCKELVAGTSLFLPIEVEGGLFSTGDGHAVQGDGEVCVTAIECPMDEVELEFLLHEGEIPGPRVRTPDSWTTLGLHEDLNEATFLAIDNMLSLLAEQHGLDKANALAIASVAIDLRITQIVNQVKGVHAVLRDDAISLARR